MMSTDLGFDKFTCRRCKTRKHLAHLLSDKNYKICEECASPKSIYWKRQDEFFKKVEDFLQYIEECGGYVDTLGALKLVSLHTDAYSGKEDRREFGDIELQLSVLYEELREWARIKKEVISKCGKNG